MQIKIPSATPTATPSGATTPVRGYFPPHSRNVGLTSDLGFNPQTAKSSNSPPPATGGTPTNYTPATAYARTKKELARVSLYAKFLPGKVITQDDLDVDETPKSTGPSTLVPKHSVMRRLAASSSTLSGAPEDLLERKLEEARKAQLKEEKAARKTAKLEKAQEKVARRRAREVKRAERAEKKERKRQRETARLSTSGKDDDSQSSEEEERKVSIVTEDADNAISAPEKPRKKKRKAESTVEQSITVITSSDVVAAKNSKKRKQD
jgi:hypothetical protein